MGKRINLVRLSLLILSFYLIGADFGIIGFSLTTNNSHQQCTNISGNCIDSHHHGSEDNVIINDFNNESAPQVDDIDVFPPINITISDYYRGTIWQPPKRSLVIS